MKLHFYFHCFSHIAGMVRYGYEWAWVIRAG